MKKGSAKGSTLKQANISLNHQLKHQHDKLEQMETYMFMILYCLCVFFYHLLAKDNIFFTVDFKVKSLYIK